MTDTYFIRSLQTQSDKFLVKGNRALYGLNLYEKGRRDQKTISLLQLAGELCKEFSHLRERDPSLSLREVGGMAFADKILRSDESQYTFEEVVGDQGQIVSNVSDIVKTMTKGRNVPKDKSQMVRDFLIKITALARTESLLLKRELEAMEPGR